MKTALIPGGSGALGTSVTLRLIDEAFRCVVPYRVVDEAQRLRSSVPPQCRDQLLLLEADMLNDDDVERVFNATLEFGGLYALVHLLGGIRGFQPIADTPVEDWDALIQLNLRSLFICARLAMRHFRETNTGRIVTIGAMASIKPSARQAGYGVAKAGVSALTKILADEGREIGVTANCILPSVIKTEANLSWGSDDEISSWVLPEQIAATVANLLHDEAAAVNGSDLRLFGALNI